MANNSMSRKSRAKRMLSMIDDEKSPVIANTEVLDVWKDPKSSKQLLTIVATKQDEDNITSSDTTALKEDKHFESFSDIPIRASSPDLNCLTSFADVQSMIMKSPSVISYDSAIFDHADFVASPSVIFYSPRQRLLASDCEAGTPEAVTPKSYHTKKGKGRKFESPKLMLEEKSFSNTYYDNIHEDIIVLQCQGTINDDHDHVASAAGTITFDADFLHNGSKFSAIKDSPTVHDLSINESTSATSRIDTDAPVPSIIETSNITEPSIPDTSMTNTVDLPIPDLSLSNGKTVGSTVPDSSDTVPSTLTKNNAKELTRKRKRFELDWESVKSKKQKNSGQEYTGCHSMKKFSAKVIKETCKCTKHCADNITQERREAIFKEFWQLGDHEDQWHYILRHTTVEDIKKMQLIRKKNRTQTITYHFRIDDSTNNKVNVCKIFFLNTLAISEKTVYSALEKGKSEDVKDKRGIHSNRPRKMSVSTEDSVIIHIKMFPVKESHYVRKDSRKMYLEETLNISKMFRLYQEWFQSEAHYSGDSNSNVKMASKRQYETVFNTTFNYSFHKPKKDMCGACSIYEHSDEERKKQLEEDHNRHMKNKQAVRLLKAKDKKDCNPATTTVAIFDLEKVLTLPQSEVGIFHYKRKYPIYNFTVYDALNVKGYCYTWHYQIAKRGSSEIGSCLMKFIEAECQRGITNFHFYSDGCAGQNKNRMIFALYIFLVRKYGINIIHRYFETGHSQSEGDAMHSCIERAKKNHTIYTPDQMYGIIINSKVTGEKFKHLDMEQCNFFDLKELMNKRYWLRADGTNEKVMWSKIHEIKVNNNEPDVLYFKYDYSDDFQFINTSQNARPARGRGRKSANHVLSNNDTLKNAYGELLPLPKPLYDDLMSLCRNEAIPKHYHPFYENLHTSGDPEEPELIIED